MDGLLNIAWKVFLFTMIITCWRQITVIGIQILKMIGELIWQFFDNVHDGIEGFLNNRKDS